MPRSRYEPLPSLRDALESRTVPELKALANLLPEELPSPARKADLILHIRDALQGEGLEDLWSRLSEVERSALREAVHDHSPHYPRERIRAKYGRDPLDGSRLSLLDLIFYRDQMPSELKQRLRAFVPKPEEAQARTVSQPPETWLRPWERWDWTTRTRESGHEVVAVERRETERAVHHELPAVLRLVQAGKVRVSEKTRRPTAASARTLQAALYEGDYYQDAAVGPIRAFAWPLLIQAGRLTKLSGTRLELNAAGRQALTAPVHETVNRLWESWIGTTLLDELNRVEAIRGQTGKGKRTLTAVEDRRRAIADGLLECPLGEWIEVQELFRLMRASGSDFEVTRNPWHLYLAEARYGSLGYGGSHDWHILQARYALCFLFEYAATLGLIEVAYVPPQGARHDYGDLWGTDDLDFLSRYDGLQYVRLNALGAYCLGASETYTPPEVEVQATLQLMPDLWVQARGDLGPQERHVLDRYGRGLGAGVWRLDLERALETAEAGHPVGELQELLIAGSSQPLPERVEGFLRDLASGAGAVRDAGPAWLIECTEGALAERIATDALTAGHCVRAGERLIVVPERSKAQFRRALRQLGYAVPPAEPGP